MAMPVKRQDAGQTQAVNVEAPRPRRSERLATRATPELKGLAEHAAALEGRSLTDFVAASIQERSERTIREREVTQVAARHARAFTAAIFNPPAPNARAREAAAFFDAVMGDRKGRLHEPVR